MSTELITAEQAAALQASGMGFGVAMQIAVAQVAEPGREVATTLDRAAIKRLHDEISTATAHAEAALESLSELCGPNPGPIAAALKGELVLGVQRYRHARDCIRALWRAANSQTLNQSKTKPQETDVR